MSSQHNPAVCFLNVRPGPLPLAIKQTTGTRWQLRPRCAGIHQVQLHPLLNSKNRPCHTEHRPGTGFVRLRSPGILPLHIWLVRLSGCRWPIDADPRGYYSQRSLPLVVSKKSFVLLVFSFRRPPHSQWILELTTFSSGTLRANPRP